MLVARTVDIAHATCGRRNPRRANLRGVFYARTDDGLERRAYAGRQSNPPRKHFRAGASPHDDEALRLATSEDTLIVHDLHQAPPPHFSDSSGRSYRSFIAVPVRAGDASFGLLTIDADQPHCLTEIDAGHLNLLAAILAAGLAHHAAKDPPCIVPHQRTQSAPTKHLSSIAPPQ